MRYEKIIKRSDGSQVLIQVTLTTEHLRDNDFWYSVGIAEKGKGKRTWYWNAPDAATREEIEQAKTELWEKLKP